MYVYYIDIPKGLNFFKAVHCNGKLNKRKINTQTTMEKKECPIFNTNIFNFCVL